MADSMVWVKCPKCSKPLGFSSEHGINKNGILFATIKKPTTCGYCKANVPVNKWLPKTRRHKK